MLKNTKTRELVKELLTNSKTPLSAYEIHKILQSQKITLSSIYRTLDTFYSNNIVSKDITSDGVSKYSIVKGEHSHFLECKKCHKTTPLDFCPYHSANKKIKKSTEFIVDEHNLIIYGTCKDCTKK